ncbi:MAG: hypothetical protein OHK0028_11300 [Deltaproteobacteria bacterium]
MDRTAVERYRLSLFGRMAMGVAHEVDNHLSVVLGFSELVQLAAGNEEKVRSGAGKILSAGERIGAVIQQFSRYARPHDPAPEPFLPGDVFREILLFAKYDLCRNDVAVDAPGDVPRAILHADRRDFGLALLALLFNGSEAMSGSGGELSLRCGLDDGGMRITVADGGTGIPAGLEETIFSEGFTTRGGPIHAGMGLPVARHIAAQAGGTVRIASRPGGGCEATIVMPLNVRV